MKKTEPSKRAYLGPGARVIVRLGRVGRPPIGTVVDNHYLSLHHSVTARSVLVGNDVFYVSAKNVSVPA